ncbi:hypothetical protein LVJ94_47765 [Pendulispora rubella]|uniref:Biosynthetic protein (TIGR04099 family) n=1 Tax=Pendulispora rubella TaxID=2741070 RepID=A0ABZ2L0W4_9BACT
MMDATYNLGMPQLICGALSERWLFKEAGDLHWKMLTSDLGVPSGELADETGERLYASFVRFRMESTVPLSAYAENETLRANGVLSRFGDKRFFSEVTFTGTKGTIKIEMGTVFVTRRTDNKSLSRATPQQLGRAKSKVLPAVPTLGQGYQRIKRLALEGTAPADDRPLLELAGERFDATENATDDVVPYEVNPFYDFNGASLLYFASYPRIHDVCERALFNPRLARAGRADQRADSAFALKPMARDISYFGNADAGDRLAFRLRKVEAVGSRLKVWSSLSREKDGERIADLFTVKEASDGAAQALLNTK